MTELFLVLLGSAWLVLLAPAALRARRNAPLWTAARFRRRMQLMAPRRASAGRWVLAPGSPGGADRSARRVRARSQRRRTQTLMAIVALVPLTLVIAVARGGAMWLVPVAAVGALAGYVLLLLYAKRRRAESVEVVRGIARRREEPAFVDFLDERRA